MNISVPHFDFPFALNGTDFATVEQDTAAEIENSVLVLLLTPIGSRIVLPTYGTPEVLFTQAPPNIAGISAAIASWEPRASATLSETIDAVDEKIAYIQATIVGGN